METVKTLRRVRICENDFGYNSKIGVYAKLSSDMNELYEIQNLPIHKRIKGR